MKATIEAKRLLTPSSLTGVPQPLRVLIIEDDVDGAESMAVILRLAGFGVRFEINGSTGLAAADDFQPDIVLLDLGLPGLNGFEVAKRLRKTNGAGLHIIAISGYCQSTDRERSRKAGIDQHLAKPVNPESLLKYLATVPRRG
jgi:DNA-binding response OmpR family regulator